MRGANNAIRQEERQEWGRRLFIVAGVTAATERGLRLAGLAADEDPEHGFLGVLSLRDVAQLCEEHQVAQARAEGWTWAQIAAALRVSRQAVHQRHAARLTASATHDR